MYPKIETKGKKTKLSIHVILNGIGNVIFTGIGIFRSIEYFFLFMVKSFHF